jgi:hypothetical protein
MKFGEALEVCKVGLKITRSGWNGKNQFVYWSPPFTIKIENITNPVLREWAEKERGKPTERRPGGAIGLGDEVDFHGHFDFKPSNNKIQCGWLASQSDMQADDWQEYKPQ